MIMDSIIDRIPDIDEKINAGNSVFVDNPDKCSIYFDKTKKSLKIVAQNIRSIKQNFNNFEILLTRLKVNCDFITLTECWLPKTDNIPLLSGYVSYATKNHINQNSGIVIYIKDTIQNIQVSEPSFKDANILLVEIGEHTAIINIYRPPSFKQIEPFVASLDKQLCQLKKYQNIIIVGDINIDIKDGNNDIRSPQYINLLTSHGLLPTHLFPTRINNCLDHCYIKTTFNTTTLVCDSNITDHATIITALQCNKLKHFRSLQTSQKVDYMRATNELSNYKWDNFYLQFTDPNSATQAFTNILKTILEKHTVTYTIPKRKIILKPWVSPGLLRCIRFRDILHARTKKEPNNEVLKVTFLRYRNYCNKILKNLKKQYEIKLIQDTKGDLKRTWQTIKDICNLQKSRNDPNELLNITNNSINSVALVNQHFVNVGKQLANKILKKISLNESDLNKYLTKDTLPLLNSFVLLPTHPQEIRTVIKSLRNTISCGWDGIPSKLYKLALDFLVVPITYICNLCLEQGVFPTDLKKSIVTPIFKSGNKDNVNNYRPISLLPTLSKIFEKIINSRLLNFLERHNLLSTNQYGFRAKKSTTDAINKLVTHIVGNLDVNKKCVGIFLDLAKAFDTVSIPLLLKKLDYFGVRGITLKLFESYLTSRTQIVKIGTSVSSPEVITCGLPQGSVLAPTLFLIYIDSLCRKNLVSGQIISFADDTAVLFSGDTWDEVNKRAEEGFSIITKWLDYNLLTLNIEKTKYIKFSIKNNKNNVNIENFSLKVHDCNKLNNCECYTLSSASSLKYLGIIIDQNLRWSDHIKLLIGRVRKLIYIFRGLRHVGYEHTINVYYSLCQSIIAYGILAWGGAGKKLMLELERAQRAVLKVIINKPYRYPTNKLYKELKILTVRQLFIKSLITCQHRNHINLASTLNKRHSNPYKTPICKTSFSQKYAAFLGPHIYNKINKHINISTCSLYCCKKKIDNYLKLLNYDDTENLLMTLR